MDASGKEIEAVAKDYAARWYGDDWHLMDDDQKAELRIEAHRWLKCRYAVEHLFKDVKPK